jgi:hypothetical protein
VNGNYIGAVGDELAFWTDGFNERMRIDSNGNVGIGNTAPLSKLGITGNASIGATYGAIAAPTSGMIVEGNVGIGTTTPSQEFEVYTAGSPTIAVSNASQQWGIQTRSDISDSFNIRNITTPANAFTITTSGNVGIGTTAPSNKFHVYADNTSASTGVAIIEQDGTGDSSLQFSLSATANWIAGIDNSDSDSFKISSGNTLGTNDYLTIANSGNVGIGTTSPTFKLSVSGTAGFSGLTGGTGGGSLCLSASNEVVFNSGSDACLPSLRETKNNIQTLDFTALDMVNELESVSFVYNQSDGRTRYGFIAEDAAVVDALLATYDAEGKISGIDDRSMIAVVLKAVQEMWSEVQSLLTWKDLTNDEITTLKDRISALEAELDVEEVTDEGENESDGETEDTSSDDSNNDDGTTEENGTASSTDETNDTITSTTDDVITDEAEGSEEAPVTQPSDATEVGGETTEEGSAEDEEPETASEPEETPVPTSEPDPLEEESEVTE